jgi:hypothetical protein
MKKTFTLTLFTCSLAGMALLLSFSNGNNNNLVDFTGAPSSSGTCANCHSMLTSGSGITLAGIGTDYKPDSTYNLTLTIDQPGATNGFQLTIIDASGNSVGTLTPGNDNVVKSINGRSLVQHGSAKSGDSWDFTWQAPSSDAGQLSIYMSGNAANGNGGTSGDQIYNLSQTLDLENNTSTGNVVAQRVEARLFPISNERLQVVDVQQNQTAVIVSLEGRIIRQVNLVKGVNTLSIQDLSKGYYFLKLEKEAQQAMAFVKP